ncbi:MAG: hypothetical protein AAB557_03710 [Patescibacteria group bacterium]
MKSKQYSVRYLFRAKVEIDRAIEAVNVGNNLGALCHTKNARHLIGISARYVVDNHIRTCVGAMMMTASSDRIVDEVVKSYKIATK